MPTRESLRWLAASAELDRALELLPDERGRYLSILRARDATLAADVALLLDEHWDLIAAGHAPNTQADVASALHTATTRTWSGETTQLPPTDHPRLGPYRIVRRLGHGGMGTVYEADEIDSGRRVALKVLKERVNDPRERERFTREGRLAASINHSHCVFVFAALETDGRLAIAMELMQGTLADRLKMQGPMPPAEAVDATLQLVTGLQAASAIGILHRDVKPSNCFVGAEGVIKIGDFGISRSLRPTEETALSTRTRFAATPSYASPEQLRGGVLDVRADIYSLGATLYELLTERPPFQCDDLMALLMAVANDTPEPPHKLNPAVPEGLSQIVLRCLAKRPDQRFADYDALAAALEPYASTAARPAPPSRRFVAGVVDQVLLGVVGALVSLWWIGVLTPIERALPFRQPVAWFFILLAYFGVVESVWAASPGKALLGLTLADRNGRAPRSSRAMARATLFAAFWSVGAAVWLNLTPAVDVFYSPGWIVFVNVFIPLDSVGAWSLAAAAFSTARRRNGYAAWHDFATGTRVVQRSTLAEKRFRSQSMATARKGPTVDRIGPYEVTEGAISGMPPGWRPGFDEQLRRPVWIRQVPAGTPPIDATRCGLSRPTRLRWLAGRRESGEAWDAFEAISGVPLEQACSQPRRWVDVRWWLLDLARECVAQTPEDAPPLRSDRVWILDSGSAKLVDDPITDGTDRPLSDTRRWCAGLLLDVVRAARGPSIPDWPLSAHRFIDRLRDASPAAVSIASDLELLTRQRGVLTRSWRALHLLGLLSFPLLLSGFGLFMFLQAVTWARQLPRDVHVVRYCLTQLRAADMGYPRASTEVEAIEIILATRYRQILTDPRMATQDYGFLGFYWSEQVARVLRRRPTAAEERLASQDGFVRSIEVLGDKRKVRSTIARSRGPSDDRRSHHGLGARRRTRTRSGADVPRRTDARSGPGNCGGRWTPSVADPGVRALGDRLGAARLHDPAGFRAAVPRWRLGYIQASHDD